MWPVVVPAPVGPVETGPVPTFSVIVAAYQAAHLIGEALKSALAQDPPPLEVIVCDDGSTDDLAGAVREVDERIRLIRIEHGGEAAAKNAAARAAAGEFVSVLDADDIYLPGRLEALGRLAAERPDLDILTTDAWLEVSGRRIGRCYGEGNPFAVRDQRAVILERNFVLGLAAVRRGRLLAGGGFDEGIEYTTDWECWIRLILDGSRVGLVDAPLACYRIREGAMSARRSSMARGRVESLTRALAHPALRPVERGIVLASLGRERARFDREALEEAVMGRGPDVRRLAGRVVRGSDQPAMSRLKAAATAAAPGIASSVVRRRRRGTWKGVGERVVAR